MENLNLLAICLSAFVYVFVILVILAFLIRLIMLLFPAAKEADDAALLAAISSTYTGIFPGTKVTNIEELK